MSVEFDLSEVTRLAAEFDAAPAKVTRISSQKMTEIAAELRDASRASAPVDTGELRNSIHVQGGQDYRIIKADARHAVFVHFGTSDTAPQPFMWQHVGRTSEQMSEAFAELADPFTP